MSRLQCKRCGAYSPMSAQWCTQCLARFAHAGPSGADVSESTQFHSKRHQSAPQSWNVLPSVSSVVVDKIKSNLELPCSSCGFRRATGVTKLWVIRGFLIFHRFGSVPEITCDFCRSSVVIQHFFKNLLFGWWGFPWGLGTPIVLVQNLAALGASSSLRRRDLDELTRSIGIDIERELTEILGFIESLVALASAVARADGAVMRSEINAVTEICTRFSDGMLPPDLVKRWIIYGYTTTFDPRTLDRLSQRLLLTFGVIVALVDGKLSDPEISLLKHWESWLGLPGDTVENILSEFAKADSSDSNASTTAVSELNRQKACAILGVAQDASLIEIKKRYRELMLRYHPDMAPKSGISPSEATSKAAEINWAYQVLRGTAA